MIPKGRIRRYVARAMRLRCAQGWFAAVMFLLCVDTHTGPARLAASGSRLVQVVGVGDRNGYRASLADVQEFLEGPKEKPAKKTRKR